MSAKALHTTGKGTDFQVVSVDPPAPGPNDISIRVKAASLNPLDWKRWLLNILGDKHPLIMGSEASGVVEAVGSDVKTFKVGDEVVALTGKARAGGAFQEVTVVPATQAVRRPANVALEDAAGLLVAFLTAAAALYAHPAGLGNALPFLPGADQTVRTPFRSVLVLGGSSGVGAAAVQLLRLAAAPGTVILATSSPRHHARLTGELGVDKAFDQNSSTLVEDVKAASPGGQGVDIILDAVYALSTDQKTLQALNADGPKVAVVVTAGAPFSLPEDIRKIDSSSYLVNDRPGAQGLMATLPDLMEKGQFKMPYKVEVAGTGLESIQAAILKLKEGVSGTKLIVKLP